MIPTMTSAGWAPGVVQFREYQRRWLRGDVLAGLTVAAYLIPQAMAYATVAGLPPAAGLWASIAPLAITHCSDRPGSFQSARNPPPP